MNQLSFASLDFASKKKRTKRDVFLGEMETVVPWVALEGVIEPHYPKTGPQGGRRPFPLAVMLRIYCLQQWYNLSDPGAEEALYDIQSMRAFCGLELGRDAIPDETTILNFRHLLERPGQLFARPRRAVAVQRNHQRALRESVEQPLAFGPPLLDRRRSTRGFLYFPLLERSITPEAREVVIARLTEGRLELADGEEESGHSVRRTSRGAGGPGPPDQSPPCRQRSAC